MGRRYTAVFDAVAVTAVQDFFEILAPTDAIVVVHGFNLFQTTDLGDAQEEVLRLYTQRGVGSVTSGTGGTTPTAQPIEDGDAAFGGTVEANNTTQMVVGTGTLETLERMGWNIRVPFDKIYTPETRPVVSPGNRFVLGLAAAPADSVTVTGTIVFEEIGG